MASGGGDKQINSKVYAEREYSVAAAAAEREPSIRCLNWPC